MQALIRFFKQNKESIRTKIMLKFRELMKFFKNWNTKEVRFYIKIWTILIFIIIFIYFIYFAWAYTGALEILWQPKSIINSRFFVIKVVFTVLISLYLAYKGQFRKLLFATIIIGPYHVIRNIIMFTFRYYETRVTYFEGVFYKAYGFVFTHQFNVFERAQYVRQKAKEHGINLGDQEILTMAEKNRTIAELNRELQQARAKSGGFTNIPDYLGQLWEFVQNNYEYIIPLTILVVGYTLVIGGWVYMNYYYKPPVPTGNTSEPAAPTEAEFDFDKLYMAIPVLAFIAAVGQVCYGTFLYLIFGTEIEYWNNPEKWEESKKNKISKIKSYINHIIDDIYTYMRTILDENTIAKIKAYLNKIVSNLIYFYKTHCTIKLFDKKL